MSCSDQPRFTLGQYRFELRAKFTLLGKGVLELAITGAFLTMRKRLEGCRAPDGISIELNTRLSLSSTSLEETCLTSRSNVDVTNRICYG